MRVTQTRPDRCDCGMTLFETMLTLVVMSIVMTMVATTLISVQRATNQIQASSSAIDEARLLSASLDRELRSADCISSPGDNQFSTTLTFRTTINRQAPVMLTYQLEYGEGTENGTVTRQEGAGTPRSVVTVVGPQPAGAVAGPFKQVSTPGPSLRTLEVNIPIRSTNGGAFQLVTTVAGRNSWRPCT